MYRFIALLVLMVSLVSPALAQVIFTSPVTINASDTTYENQDIIVRGTTVTINGSHTFNSLKIDTNGVITHSPKGDPDFAGGLNLSILTNCTIDIGSRIDVTGKGWPTGQGPGAGVSPLNAGGAGGSYGGEGGYGYSPNPFVYGNLTTLADLGGGENLGSGGGTGYTGVYSGSAGGGALRLKVTGAFNLNGTVISNGATSPSHGGAGSGGSIYLDLNAWLGGGAVLASGGYGNGQGGGGGGGRIVAHYVDKSQFFGSVLAPGNRSNDYGTWAGAGTVVLKTPGQTYGDLIVDNQGAFGFSTVLVAQEQFDNVTITGQGVLAPLVGGVLKLVVDHDLTLLNGGRISADGRGHPAGAGPGRGVNNAAEGGGGASFGGEGTNVYSPSGSVYGDLRDPNLVEDGTHLGSGGGTGYAGVYSGSAGGGAIRVTVNGTLKNDSFITSIGLDSPSHGGAGSGGSIYIDAQALTGIGIIRANGGYGNGRGGGGSGGRVAVRYGTLADTLTIQALGNRSNDFGTRAGAGTVFLKQTTQTYGDLVVDNGGIGGLATTLTGLQVFDNILVRNQGWLAPTYSPNSPQPLELMAIGNVNIAGGGYISADGRGYRGGQGPGAGQSSATDRGAGGSYGGQGGSWAGATSGPTYGDPDLPTDFGSGGGYAFNEPVGRPGGSGGGAIRLTVNGTLQVDGQLLARSGTDYGQFGGMGSGGSLLLRVGNLAGNGLISAAGHGGWDNIGSGGGGRIALYYVTKSGWTGTITAATGSTRSDSPAQDGTVHEQQTSGNLIPTLTLSPNTLGPGQAGVATVTLSGPAPEGGITLSLVNSDPSTMAMPPSVTIDEGQDSATFVYTANPVSTSKNVTVGVRLWDQLSSKTVAVKPWVASLRFNPASVRGGQTVTGTLTLNVPAPAGGLTVALASTDATGFPVPPTVTVTGGALTKTFTVTAGSVATAKLVTVTSSVSGNDVKGTLWINPGTAQISKIAVSPASVLGGSRVFGVVVLTAPAPTGGAIVALTSSVSSGTNPTTVPASVTVPAGKTSVSFPITTRAVASPVTVLVSGTLGVTKNATLVVTIPTVSDLQLIPSTVIGGETSIGIVTLSGPSPTPVIVTITSNHGAAVPETSIVIPAGQTNGTFFIDTNSVLSTTYAAITAKANGVGKSQQLTITP